MEASPESNSQPPSAPRAAPPPFDNYSAEIILRTADNVDFHVRPAIVEEVSSTFADMVSFPQPPAASTLAESAAHVVPLTETSEIVEPLLRVFYPARVVAPEFSSLNHLKPVLEAARKYQVDAVMQVLARSLVQFARDVPLQAYAIALHFGLEESARLAAKQFVAHVPPWPFTKELELISGAAHYRLLEYRDDCVKAAKSAIDLRWLDDTTFTWFSCRNSGGCLSRSANRLPRIFRDMQPPATCKPTISRDARRFNAKLADEVEKRVAEVVLKFSPST
ncbi:hypothetical protein BV20DRAFT_981594 [Pilatotrama ljubarskyi]|nr:hypothetical protein BV20DRAFT_981594 [Pilatotrama ljubarskyi]